MSCETWHNSFNISAKHPITSVKDKGYNDETVIVSFLIFCEEHSGEHKGLLCCSFLTNIFYIMFHFIGQEM